MSSSSCYDDSPTELSDDENKEELKGDANDDAKTVVITQTKVVARRFEFWHEKFLSYKEILDYLVKLSEYYQHRCTIERLGYSEEKRPICLVKICTKKVKRPQMSVLIEAGSNGSEKMTVSSILYLIDYLVKNELQLVVEYLIIPCLNADGYEKFHENKKITRKEQSDLDMSKCFPLKSERRDQNGNTLSFNTNIKAGCSFLSKVVEKYRMTIKLFISLQASECAITYPLENYFKEVYDFALASKKAMEWDSLDVKPIVPTLTKEVCTSVEHVIRNYNQNIKFAYILNVHNKSFKPEEKFILTKGEQTLNGILTLTKRVYRYYKKKNTNCNVKTTVKLLDTTE